jgi:putative SOS response-associated peptidase YedK
MCNHYSKGQKKWDRDKSGGDLRQDELIEWSVTRIPLRMPAALPAFNDHIYPKYPAPVIIQVEKDRQLVAKTWGIPISIKGATKRIVKPVTNARNDKLTGFTWGHSTRHRRCLIPATGYFEPGLGPVGAKGEILFTVKARPMFFFAGLWDGDSFTMVTTEPNEFVRKFHDRMPVVLSDDDALAWLGEDPLPEADLQLLCRGLPAVALDHEEIAPRPKAGTGEMPKKLPITKKNTKAPPPDDQPPLL